MKIVAEMGERITIVVPVTTEDGLIGKVAECVIRRDGTDNTGRK
jgi:hypothetical protein